MRPGSHGVGPQHLPGGALHGLPDRAVCRQLWAGRPARVPERQADVRLRRCGAAATRGQGAVDAEFLSRRVSKRGVICILNRNKEAYGLGLAKNLLRALQRALSRDKGCWDCHRPTSGPKAARASPGDDSSRRVEAANPACESSSAGLCHGENSGPVGQRQGRAVLGPNNGAVKADGPPDGRVHHHRPRHLPAQRGWHPERQRRVLQRRTASGS